MITKLIAEGSSLTFAKRVPLRPTRFTLFWMSFSGLRKRTRQLRNS